MANSIGFSALTGWKRYCENCGKVTDSFHFFYMDRQLCASCYAKLAWHKDDTVPLSTTIESNYTVVHTSDYEAQQKELEDLRFQKSVLMDVVKKLETELTAAQNDTSILTKKQFKQLRKDIRKALRRVILASDGISARSVPGEDGVIASLIHEAQRLQDEQETN